MLRRSYGSEDVRVPTDFTPSILWGKESEELKASEEGGPSFLQRGPQLSPPLPLLALHHRAQCRLRLGDPEESQEKWERLEGLTDHRGHWILA